MANFPFLFKVTGAAVLTGAITLGAMTTWNGTETVNNAITTIQKQARDLGIYANNETKLVAKIEELKNFRDSLEVEVASLSTQNDIKQAEIDELNNQIANLDAEILALKADLATANQNGEELAERIDALENELQTANADIDRLQAELNSIDTSAYVPLTEAEMATILEQDAQ